MRRIHQLPSPRPVDFAIERTLQLTFCCARVGIRGALAANLSEAAAAAAVHILLNKVAGSGDSAPRDDCNNGRLLHASHGEHSSCANSDPDPTQYFC